MTRSDVVHFFATLERGGAEMRTLELLQALGPEAKRHRVVTLAREGGALAEAFRQAGVRVDFIRARSLHFPWRLRQRVGGAAVFHTHLGLIGGPILALGKLLGVPVRIAHFRSDGADVPSTLRHRALLRAFKGMVKLFATDIVGVSPGALSSGYEVGWKQDARCRVMLSGLDLEPYAEAEPSALHDLIRVEHGAPVVLHIGRDHPVKNRIKAIEVFAGVATVRPDAHLVFVGRNEGSTLRRQQELARRLGVAERVHWLGERPDVPDLLRGASVTLMTSTREGLPGTVLESVAAGTPVVASDLPGSAFLARYFPQDISLRRLDDANDLWVEDVVAVLRRMRGAEERRQSWSRVNESPFERSRCVGEFRSLWSIRG